MTEQQERRDYFRINDTIGLSYSVLDGSSENSAKGTEGKKIELDSVLTEIDAKFNQAANTVWQENPAVAEALGLLNRKISIVAARAPQGANLEAPPHEEFLANISGCGMAFHCVEPLAEGTRLSVSVVIKPSNIDVNFIATVIACEPSPESPDGKHLMRIEIDEESHLAKEQLIQHVVQKQYAAGKNQDSRAEDL